MKELRQKTLEWLKERFGGELYDDLCCKKSVEEVADYFLENHSADEIERDGLDVCLESWTYKFISAESLEFFYNKKQIEMLQENACAANEGRPCVYTEEEILEAK